MKKILYILTIGMIGFASCADPDLGPVITFEDAQKGVSIALVELRAIEYDLADIANSAVDYTVEFVDVEQGGTVADYSVYVSYVDNNPDNGDNSVAQKLYQSFGTGDFSTNENGFVGLDVRLPLTDVAASLGVETSSLVAGDVFAFATEVTDRDGNTFGSGNSSSAVRGTAFRGFFDFNGNATCPLPDDIFVGDYALTYDNVAGGWGVSLVEETVTLRLIPGSTTRRQFDATFLPNFGGFAVAPIIEFVCDKVVAITLDSGVGCAGTSIKILNRFDGVDYFQPQDITDDAVILIDYVEDGEGCGYAALRNMRLTKL